MLAELVDRIRRNHGLEHASIHMLSARHKNFSAQGSSDPWGFRLNIYGDISEESVYDAVEEAYRRLKAGEHHLAVHPNCGTVLLTTATLATLTAQATFGLERIRQRRTRKQGSVTSWALMLNALPSAILAVVAALIVSRPLGVGIQARYTTKGDLGDLEISRIRPVPASLISRLFQLLLTPGKRDLKTRSYRIDTIG